MSKEIKEIKMATDVGKLLAAIFLGLYVVAAALFAFTMKKVGLSIPELGIVFVALVAIGFGIGSLVIKKEVIKSTLVLSIIITILLTIIIVASMTIFLDRIMSILVL